MSITDDISGYCGQAIGNTFRRESATVNIGVYSIDRDAMGWFHDRDNPCGCLGSVGFVLGTGISV